MELPEFLTKKYMGIPGWAIVGAGIGVGAFILWRQKSASTTAATTGTAGGTASPSTYGDWQYGYGGGSNPSPPPTTTPGLTLPSGLMPLSQLQSQYPDLWSWLSGNGMMSAIGSNASTLVNPAYWLQNYQTAGFGSAPTPPAYTVSGTTGITTAQQALDAEGAYQPSTIPSGTNPAPTPQIAAPAPAFLSGAPA